MINEETIKLLYDTIEPESVDIFSMEIGKVLSAMLHPEGYVKEKKLSLTRSIAWMKGFSTAIDNAWKVLNSIPVENNAMWSRATQEVGGGITLAENILCETVNYYNLHSISDAEKLPFADWFIMKRRELCQSAVSSRYEKLQLQQQNGSKNRQR